MRQSHERARRAACVAAPIVMLVAARVLFTGAPAPASGSIQLVVSAGLRPAAVRLSPAQEGVLAWLRAFDASAEPASPFITGLQSRPTPTPIPAPTSTRFRLTGVIGAGTDDEALASINGRVYRVGMEVAPGVRLVRISARGREAELRLADGTVLLLNEDSRR